jgi:hypothetical protein
MKTLQLTFGMTLSILLSAAARADLKWEQTTIELHPAISDKQAIAHFKYQNIGKTPVRFKSVHASCGCTTAQTQKEEVPPNEKGEITATFTIGDRTGMQVKSVTVQTDDPDPAKANLVLTLKANITAPVEIKPAFVYWRGGEEATPKAVMVTAAKEFPVKTLSVKSTSPDFTTKVSDGGSPGTWKIDIQPKDTAHAIATAIMIQTDFPKEAPRSFSVNAQVTNPPSTQTAPIPSPAAAVQK